MDIDFDALPPEEQQAILNGPAGMPPEGVQPQLDDPPKDNVMTLAVLGVSLFIIAVVVLIRAYAKIFCTRKVRVEDGLGLLAVLGIAGHAWSVIAMSQSPGMYVHVWDMRVKDGKSTTLEMNLLRTFYSLFQLFSKDAILLEWIHIFVARTTRKRFFWLCWALIVVNTALYISFIFTTHLRCVPQEKMWFPWVEGRCIDMMATDVTIMVFNLVCDILILLLPQSIIWKLQLKRRQKLGLSFLFSLGLLTVGCAAGRVHATVEIDYAGDWLHDVPIIIVWGVAESTFVMMVLCVPAAPQVFKTKGVGLGSKLARSLPWTSASRMRSRSAKESTSNSTSNPTVSTNYQFYHKMDEGGSQVALTELGSVGGGSIGGPGGGEPHLQHPAAMSPVVRAGPGVGGRIVKTTELATSSEDRRGGDEDAGGWASYGRDPRRGPQYHF